MYICGQGNICSYGKPPVQFDSNQPRSVMFAWHVQWNEEKHTNLIITDLRNGERARQLVFHHKLMQYHLSSDLFITLPLFWFSTSRFHQPFMRHLWLAMLHKFAVQPWYTNIYVFFSHYGNRKTKRNIYFCLCAIVLVKNLRTVLCICTKACSYDEHLEN